MNANQTVAEIVRDRPGAAATFERFGIDYCCGGQRALAEACARAGVTPETVLAAIAVAPEPSAAAPAFERLDELIEHLERTHHAFTREAMARLPPLADKVLRVHGAAHPELEQVALLVEELKADLLPHLMKEEGVLFPFIREVSAATRQGGALPRAPFGSLAGPLSCMHEEHDRVGELLRSLRACTSGYAAPDTACGSYRALYAGLAELEADLHQHIHLENNVLFPGVEAESAALRAR